MQFKCQNSSISSIQDSTITVLFYLTHIRTLTDAITPGQSGPGSGGNVGVVLIHPSSRITGASPSDHIVSYTGHSLWESYFFADWPSVCVLVCICVLSCIFCSPMHSMPNYFQTREFLYILTLNETIHFILINYHVSCHC